MFDIAVCRWFGRIPVCSSDLSGLSTKADWKSSAIASILLATLFFFTLPFFRFFLAHRIFIYLIALQSEQKYRWHQICLFSHRKENIIYYEFPQQMSKQKTKKKLPDRQSSPPHAFPPASRFYQSYFFLYFFPSPLTPYFHYHIPPKNKRDKLTQGRPKHPISYFPHNANPVPIPYISPLDY